MIKFLTDASGRREATLRKTFEATARGGRQRWILDALIIRSELKGPLEVVPGDDPTTLTIKESK